MLRTRHLFVALFITVLLPVSAHAGLIRFQAQGHFTSTDPLPGLAVDDPVTITLFYDADQADTNADGDPDNRAYSYNLREFQVSLPRLHRSYHWLGGGAGILNDFGSPATPNDEYVFAITYPDPPMTFGDYFTFEVALAIVGDSSASIISDLLPATDIDLSVFNAQRVITLRMSKRNDSLACLGDTCDAFADIDSVRISQVVSEPGVSGLIFLGLFGVLRIRRPQ